MANPPPKPGVGAPPRPGVAKPAAPAAAPAAAAEGDGAPFDFKAVLQQLTQANGSDLHLKVGRPPTMRLNGDLTPMAFASLKPEDLKGLAEQLMNPKDRKSTRLNSSHIQKSRMPSSA